MRRTITAVVSAALLILFGVFAVATANTASAATNCRSVFHYSAYDGASNTYDIYKYECDNNQTYGLMTGNPGPACITISHGSVSDGTCWSIPTGYTPPRTSISTSVMSAGNTMKLVYICFNNYYHVTLSCHNDYG